MQSFQEFLLGKLSHLKQFYKDEAEFNAHLLSGEVTVTIPDLINYQSQYQEILSGNTKSPYGKSLAEEIYKATDINPLSMGKKLPADGEPVIMKEGDNGYKENQPEQQG